MQRILPLGKRFTSLENVMKADCATDELTRRAVPDVDSTDADHPSMVSMERVVSGREKRRV
jgi:hypothetical protein